MKKGNIIVMAMAIFLMAFIIINPAAAQRQMERLNRGLVAVSSGGGYFLSWRLFGDEPLDTGFNVYKGSIKLNASPITSATCYQDSSGGSGTYTVRAVINGQEQEASENARVLSGNYLSIPVTVPSGYEANDASVGDLDGDGEYEIVLKIYPLNAKDNSQDGVTDPTILDAYELDGTRLWSINLGRNIRSGAHYTQFMVYDLDGDGRAEVACKTADGSRDGQGNVIGDANANYVNSSGYILDGPEFLTVFDGQTGRALSTVDYIPARGNVSSWGDSYGNRVDRFLACVAYLDGSRPSLVMCRGYYTRMVLAAWDFRNGSLSHRWTFDTNNGYGSYEGQGNHNLSVADVDNDGRDEIIYGSAAIDDNGSGLWNTGLGHGDAMHVSDINPDRSGFEVWGIHEGDGTPGSALLDARTGQILWQTGNADTGRGCSADLTSSQRGMECWGNTSGLRSCTNASAGGSPSSANHVVWWDGDLLRELLDGTSISKYNSGTLLSASGCTSNNGTKSNPCLQVDIWGDWREEVIWKSGSTIRIYTTTTSTNHRFYTLMHDYVYRLGIAWQNVAYNQPPHTSYFLGDGMSTPPQPDIFYAGGGATVGPTNPPEDTPVPTPTGTPGPTPAGGNIALNQPVTASSEQSGDGNNASNGNDGSDTTRWCADGSSTPQWWQVDLGGLYSLTGTRVMWEFDGTVYNYTIEVSADGSNWNQMVDKTNNADSSQTQTDTFSASNVRYVRLTITSLPSTDVWASFFEFEVFGESGGPVDNLGDVNNDGSIDIVDALLTAQYYVGLNPGNFNPAHADTNCDGSVDIVDALLIAQYYVGLISGFC
jgi:rhamnogalacturonan endolyase